MLSKSLETHDQLAQLIEENKRENRDIEKTTTTNVIDYEEEESGANSTTTSEVEEEYEEDGDELTTVTHVDTEELKYEANASKHFYPFVVSLEIFANTFMIQCLL